MKEEAENNIRKRTHEYLEKGFTIKSIRLRLLVEGYNIHSVDKVINSVVSDKVRKELSKGYSNKGVGSSLVKEGYSHSVVSLSKISSKKINLNYLIVLSVLLFTLGFFIYTNTGITGYSVLMENTDNVNLVFEETGEYTWVKEGSISNVRLNGRITGDGVVRVFLDDYLVYSTENSNLISGAAVYGFVNEDEIKNETLGEEIVIGEETKNKTTEEPLEIEKVNEPEDNGAGEIIEELPEGELVRAITLENVCGDLCGLTFEQNEYTLRIEIGGDATLVLNSIKYSAEEAIEKVSEGNIILVEEIPNQTIGLNSVLELNLLDYFSDLEGRELTFGFETLNLSNIEITVDGGIAGITSKDTTEVEEVVFYASNGNGRIRSNEVEVIAVDIIPGLESEKIVFEASEDAEFNFEYINDEEFNEIEEIKESIEDVRFEEDSGTLEAITGLVVSENKGKEDNINETQEGKWVDKKEAIEVTSYHSDGSLADLDVKITKNREGKFKINLGKERAFRAGRYRLEIKFVKDGKEYNLEQDFSWGVLAINVHKSIYLPNEESFIGIGVLDDLGKVVCDADVTLEITDPNNNLEILSTDNGRIKISDECKVYGVTNLPDYYGYYGVKGAGNYMMELTAVTSNGVKSIKDNFEVRDSVEFDVSREGPTRVYPLDLYTMRFTIKANEDYNGFVNEYVPSSFKITKQDDLRVKEVKDEKILSWNVKFDKGESYVLSYEFDAPDISPEFYVLGPLEIGKFSEIRQWQIANDALIRLGVQGARLQNRSSAQNTFSLPPLGTYPANCGNGGDRLSCDDNSNEQAFSEKSGASVLWGGVNITIYNSSITDCSSITKVELCYEFWGAATQHNCWIGVDNDDGASWVNGAVACSTTAPGVVCADVTANETDWVCGNFFGASGTRALAKAQAQKTAGSGVVQWNFDVLYFNITYTSTSDDTAGPLVDLQSPANNSWNFNNSAQFNFNTTDATSGIYNCSLYTNESGSWILEESNNSVITEGSSYNITHDLNNGAYLWNVRCYDDSSNKNDGWDNANWTVTLSGVSFCNNNYNISATDWNVAKDVECKHQTFNVDGNITVLNNGNLTLINTTIGFNSSCVNGCNISVERGGELYIRDNDLSKATENDRSIIDVNGSFINYNFYVYSSNFTVRYSKIIECGNRSSGIELIRVDSANITGSEINCNNWGVSLVGSNYTNITDTNFTGLEGGGINITDGSRYNIIQQNIINGTCTKVVEADQTCDGINACGTSNIDNNITYNNIRNIGDGAGDGIDIEGTTNNGIRIQFNNITNIPANSIEVASANNVVIYSNIIDDPTGDGISLADTADSINITSNTITHSGEDGIDTNGADSAVIYSNNISDIFDAGIEADTTTTEGVIENNVISNVTDAIRFQDSAARNHVINLTAFNATNGIVNQVTATAFNNVTNSTFRSNVTQHFNFSATADQTMYALNNTFDKSKASILSTATAQNNLTVRWYLRVNVTDQNGVVISGASVNISENSTNTIAKLTTAADGTTIWISNLTEYWQNSTKNSPGQFNYSFQPTLFNASKVGYTDNNTAFNITDTTTLRIILGPVAKYCTGTDGYPQNGGTDWDIDSDVECRDLDFNVNGNISILNGGNLTLINTTIRIADDCDTFGCNITVQPGGELYIHDNDSLQYSSNDSSIINVSTNAITDFNFYILGSGQLSIRNSKIQDFGWLSYGIEFIGVTSRSNITGSQILNGTVGILLNGTSNVNISFNNFSEFSEGGILLNDSDFNVIYQNNIERVCTIGVGFEYCDGIGIHDGSSNNNISWNNIQNNYTSNTEGDGIDIEDSSNNNTIERNNVTNSTTNGVEISGTSTGNQVVWNTFEGNGRVTTSDTFKLDTTATNISYNTINNSGFDGIQLATAGADNNVILANNITNSGGNGVRLTNAGSSGNNISSNRIIDSADDGIEIFSNALNNIYGNTIKSHSGNGVYLQDGSANQNITNNIIIESGTNLVFGTSATTAGSDNNIVVGNIINSSFSSTIGIYMTGASDYNLLKDNIVTNETWAVNMESRVNGTDIVNLTTASDVFADIVHTGGPAGGGTFIHNVTNSTLRASTRNFQINSTGNTTIFSLNNTFSRTKVFVDSNNTDWSNLTVKWYLRVNVTDQNGVVISGASVNISDNSSNTIAKLTTAADGTTIWISNLTEYWQNDTGIGSGDTQFNYSYQPTLFNASKATYTDNNTAFNITDTQTLRIVLQTSLTTFCTGSNTYNDSATDWNINGDTECRNLDFNVNGNITVLNGGNLTLINTTIRFNSSCISGCNLNVTSGGELYIRDTDLNKSTWNDTSTINTTSNLTIKFWNFYGYSNNITLRYSEFTHCGNQTYGLQFIMVNNTNVTGNLIECGWWWAVGLNNTINVNISDNNITNTPGGGISLNNSDFNIIYKNFINNTCLKAPVGDDSCDGIHVTGGSNSNNITQNFIDRVIDPTSAHGSGIDLELSSSNNIISYNNITNTDQPNVELAQTSNNNQIVWNTFKGSQNVGIELFASAGNNISYNNFTGKSGGIALSNGGADNNILFRNNISSSTSTGIALSVAGIAGNNISENILKSNGGGFNLDTADRNNIYKNQIFDSDPNEGITLDAGSGNQNISDNEIYGSNDYEILIGGTGTTGSNDSIFFGNRLGNTTADARIGINIQAISSNNTFENNLIRNSSIGIHIMGVANNTNIINNTFSNTSVDLTVNSTIFAQYPITIYVTNSSFNGTSRHLIMNATGNNTVVFLNNTFDKSKVRIDSNNTGWENLTVKWYLRVNVTDQNGVVISGASVNISENSTNTIAKLTTAADGTTIWISNLTEYWQNDTGFDTAQFNFSYQPTLFNASKVDYTENNTAFNITDTTTLRIIMQSSADAPPNSSGAADNVTTPRVTHYVNTSSFMSDDIGIDGCMLEHNWTGTGWINDTWDNIIGNPTFVQFNYTRNIQVGYPATLGWRHYCNDTTNQWNETSLVTFTLENTPPSSPVLQSPPNGSLTDNRTANFTWFNATDPDNSSIQFYVELNCFFNMAGDCSDDFNESAGFKLNHTLTRELQFLQDDNYHYNWTVFASDSYDNSSRNASSTWNISVQSVVSILMINDTTDFGFRDIGDLINTTGSGGGKPFPLAMVNDGNVVINVTLTATQLFVQAALGSSNYRYKANTTEELNSFNYSGSEVNWTNIPSGLGKLLGQFNYSNAVDSAEVDIEIDVPLDEPGGAKQSTITFTGVRDA